MQSNWEKQNEAEHGNDDDDDDFKLEMFSSYLDVYSTRFNICVCVSYALEIYFK